MAIQYRLQPYPRNPNQSPTRAAHAGRPSAAPAKRAMLTANGTRQRNAGRTSGNGGNARANSAADPNAASASARDGRRPPRARSFTSGSQLDLAPLVGRLVDRLDDPVHGELVGRRLVRRVAAHLRHEVRELGAVGLDEGALARGGAGGRDVGGAAVELLHHAKRRQPRAAAGGQHLEPPALSLPDVRPRNVERHRDAARALQVHEHRVLDRLRALAALHVRRDALRLREVVEPERQVEEWEAVLEERAAARLRPAVAPAAV